MHFTFKTYVNFVKYKMCLADEKDILNGSYKIVRTRSSNFGK